MRKLRVIKMKWVIKMLAPQLKETWQNSKTKGKCSLIYKRASLG